MRTKYPRLSVVVAIAAAFASALFGWYTYSEWFEGRAATYFSNELRTHGITEYVSIHGVRVTVQNGVVVGEGDSSSMNLKALQIAYDMSLARRSPFFALAGTDPEKLIAAVDILAQVQAQEAEIQPDIKTKTMVEESLYPIAFLRSLADAEGKRQAFLTSGSQNDEDEYWNSLQKAITAMSSDVQRYKNAIENVPFPDASLVYTNGIETKGSLYHAISEVEASIADTRIRLAKRKNCLQGYVGVCDTLDLALPLIKVSSGENTASSTSVPSSVSAAVDFLTRTHTFPDLAKKTIYQIGDPTCYGVLPSPGYAIPLSTKESLTHQLMSVSVVNDVLLYRLTKPFAGWKTFDQLLIDEGAKYVPENDAMYYQCPEIATLYGRIFGTDAAAEVLRNSAVSKKATQFAVGTGEVIRESGVVHLIASTTVSLANAELPGPDLNRFIELSLMLQNNTAGLDRLVLDVARVNREIPGIRARGIHEGFDAAYLLLAKSGFPSLFELQNPSVTSGRDISIYERTIGALPPSAQWYSKMNVTEKSDAATSVSIWLALHASFLRASTTVSLESQ